MPLRVIRAGTASSAMVAGGELGQLLADELGLLHDDAVGDVEELPVVHLRVLAEGHDRGAVRLRDPARQGDSPLETLELLDRDEREVEGAFRNGVGKQMRVPADDVGAMVLQSGSRTCGRQGLELRFERGGNQNTGTTHTSPQGVIKERDGSRWGRVRAEVGNDAVDRRPEPCQR